MGKMKDGNKKVRWILIQAANTAARKDDRLRKFYLRIAQRHGLHIAITHVANKMMTIIWHMLVSKKLYNERSRSYTKQSLRGSKGHRLAGWSEQQSIREDNSCREAFT
jgi:hypothetical protein